MLKRQQQVVCYLAGVLLKMGGYGIIQYLINIFYVTSHEFAPFVLTLSILSIFYASLTTLRQIDLKTIICLFFSSAYELCNYRIIQF